MHSMHMTQPIATDGVAWSACLLVTFVSHVKRLNRSRCRLGELAGVGQGWGQEPHGKGQFCGLSGPLKHIGSQCCGRALRSKKINNDDCRTAPAGCNATYWTVSHYIAHPGPVKNPPSAMRPFVKSFSPLAD